MAKRKKRNALTLVSLLLALVALIGIYVWYSNKEVEEKSSSGGESDIVIASVDTSKVVALWYKGLDIDMEFILEDGIWSSVKEPERPINQSNIESMLQVISDIKAYQKVTDQYEEAAEYGLDNPTLYIKATLEDGSTTTLKLGNEAITGDGYYAVVNDDTKVYLLNYTYKLSFTNMDMTEIVAAPEIIAENITYIHIDNRDSEDIELKYSKDAILDNSGSNMYNWQILKPYGEGFSADSSKIGELQANYSSFNFIDCIDYKGDDLGQYGLDNPSAILQIGYLTSDGETVEDSTDETTMVEKEYKLYIGNKDDQGNYFVRSDTSNAVYTLGSALVDKMLEVDVFALMNPYITLPNINMVDGISADIHGKLYEMKINRTVTKDDSSEEVTKETFYYQGEEVEEESFKKLYQQMISAQYDAKLKEEVDISGLKPVVTLSYHLFGDVERTITASFLPYNDSFYITDIGKGVYFLADKRVIDDIADAITSFTSVN